MELEKLPREYAELKDWLLLGKFATPALYQVAARADGSITVQFQTPNKTYSLMAMAPKQGSVGYLGCIVEARTPQEDAPPLSGNDLADGAYSLETYCNILADIVSLETAQPLAADHATL